MNERIEGWVPKNYRRHAPNRIWYSDGHGWFVNYYGNAIHARRDTWPEAMDWLWEQLAAQVSE